MVLPVPGGIHCPWSLKHTSSIVAAPWNHSTRPLCSTCTQAVAPERKASLHRIGSLNRRRATKAEGSAFGDCARTLRGRTASLTPLSREVVDAERVFDRGGYVAYLVHSVLGMRRANHKWLAALATGNGCSTPLRKGQGVARDVDAPFPLYYLDIY